MNLKCLKTHDEIAQAFDVFRELRPHLLDASLFVDQVLQQQKEGYEVVAVMENEDVVACMGFRLITTLAWGKILYIDDLITKELYRGKGYGKALLNKALEVAKKKGCKQVHLDTGYHRHSAHKIYLSQGFEFQCHHLALQVA